MKSTPFDLWNSDEIQSIEIVLEGDSLNLTYRLSDENLVERGEKVFIEVYQKAADFRVVMENPKHRTQISALLRNLGFCDFHRDFEGIDVEELQEPQRISHAHDGMFGVLDLPDQWETVSLPDDWPSDDDFDAAGFGGGYSASSKCLRAAKLKFFDGTHEDWIPLHTASIADLVDHWPVLKTMVSNIDSSN